MKLRYLSFGIGFLVLFMTAGIFVLPRWLGESIRAEKSLHEELGRLLPSSISGAVIKDMPLGPNEFVDQKARDKLDYDDVVFRTFETSTGLFAVYVAYWDAGRYAPSFIASHTPDRCWTLAGMNCLEFKTKYILRSGSHSLDGAEWRVFSAPSGQRIQVAFWHLVGGKLHNYGGKFHSYDKPYIDPAVRVKNVINDLFSPQGRQYFIRVSSDQTFESWSGDLVFQQVMRSLARLGIPANDISEVP